MSTPNTAPDYGEPWKNAGDAAIIDRNNEYVGGYEKVDRIIACANACQGMADPAAEIEMLKLARERALDAADVLQNVTEERDELRRDVSALLNALPNGAHDVTEGVISIRAMRAAIKAASSHLSGFLGFHSEALTNAQVRSVSDCLASLQLFTKP